MATTLKPYEASAPGKVILFGEHAVVYGIPAVAAAVSSLRVSARVTFGGAPDVRVSLHNLTSMKDGQPLSRAWSLKALADATHDAAVAVEAFLPRPSAAMKAALTQFLVDEHPKDTNALRPALFLLLAILPQVLSGHDGIHISVTSGDFPVGAGLGSSAAFCVAVAAALLRCTTDTAVPALDVVNAHAFAAEVLLHDDPSGVDNTVATYGGAIVYRKTPQVMETFAMPKLRILLTNTHVPRETKVLVAGVRALHTADPTPVEAHFRTIEGLATTFQAAVHADTLSHAQLAAMISSNQASLDALHVGHASISTICALSATYGMATKLTGAGGGGCTITLVPADAADSDVAALKAELQKAGFTCLETELGGPGVEFRPVL
ncbi:Aste57867_3935 [Aphanomyces stellatus]|uniref:Mevalonate kinase n=1 Tax=Aphanomyces stellatus TaxID=120398 RepID=A0A485KAK1_9STRA|nr:hypothetical protein As57867_003924 [Aphanomyces stellatus]VFT81072.1 Aste57867_3935 [Aphanomyces stellatus]